MVEISQGRRERDGLLLKANRRNIPRSWPAPEKLQRRDNLRFRMGTFTNLLPFCVWQEHLAHFGGLIWPTLSD